MIVEQEPWGNWKEHLSSFSTLACWFSTSPLLHLSNLASTCCCNSTLLPNPCGPNIVLDPTVFWFLHKFPPYHSLFPNSGFPCLLGLDFPSVGLGWFSRGVLPGLVRAGYCHNEPNKGVRAQWWRRARLTHHHWPARAARPASATHHCHQKHPRALIGQEALWARRAWLARPIGRERRTAAASMLSCNDFAPEEDLGSLNAHPPLPSIHF